jgi:molybdate transport system substrate-binding protein
MKPLLNLFSLVALSLLAACGKNPAAPTAEPLMVYAAAGTAPAMKAIAAEFTRQTGVEVIFNFANAGVLAKQITNGGTANIFFSANEKWMDYVAEQGKIVPETRRVLLRDEMVIIVPKGRTLSVDFTQPADGQTFAGNFAIGDQSTPLGIYARQAFTQLGWWTPLQNQLCVGDTVNKVLHYVVLDEADAGVVFHSVASCAADQVTIVATVPVGLHKPIRFPIAACTRPPPQATAFLAFTDSPAARTIFKKKGWTLWTPNE